MLTADRYLAIERMAKEKCEYYRGEMFAMAGASAMHNLVVANLIRAIGNALVQSPCLVFASDLRVSIDRAEHYVYPDVLVLCGEAEYLDDSFDTLLNPTMVVEVLSESTERYDRGLKFAGYRALASVQTIIFVNQTKQSVEVYTRQPDDQWLLKAYEPTTYSNVVIPYSAIEIPLTDIYRGVEFSEPT